MPNACSFSCFAANQAGCARLCRSGSLKQLNKPAVTGAEHQVGGRVRKGKAGMRDLQRRSPAHLMVSVPCSKPSKRERAKWPSNAERRTLLNFFDKTLSETGGKGCKRNRRHGNISNVLLVLFLPTPRVAHSRFSLALSRALPLSTHLPSSFRHTFPPIVSRCNRQHAHEHVPGTTPLSLRWAAGGVRREALGHGRTAAKQQLAPSGWQRKSGPHMQNSPGRNRDPSSA